jgi:phage shock protein A
MPSPKGSTPEDLEEQARMLQQLIDDAQALQKEITDHLKQVRRENRSNVQWMGERRKRHP